MKCVICRTGETHRGTTTETYEDGDRLVVVRGIPAAVCGQCGEAYTDEATTRRVEAIVKAARSLGPFVVSDYQAA